MAKFISKCFSEIALMAAAVLWAGCSDVDKNSKNEKPASKALSSSSAEILSPVESTDSATPQNAVEKDDSFFNAPQKDSIDANSKATVLLDSAKKLEVKRARDSLMKAFFPIERKDKACMEKVNAGLRYDIGNLLKYGSVKRYECIRKRKEIVLVHPRWDIGMKTRRYYDENLGRDIDDILKSLIKANLIQPIVPVKVLLENIKSANKQTLSQEMYSRVTFAFRQRTPSLRHIYGKFLKKDSVNTFEGKITLKLSIAADGTVKESSINSSTTGVRDFDEEIRNAVSRWTFSKVKSGNTVVYVSIRFYKDDQVSSRSK